MEINYLEIGTRIRAMRKKYGITQEKLAERANVGTAHISHIETGNTIPSLKTFVEIVNELGGSADALLCDHLERTPIIFQEEIAQALSDCSETELQILSDLIPAIKQSLRRRL